MTDVTDARAWVAARRRAGWGEGEGAEYKPWITVKSFGSHGRVFRALGRHGRTYQFLSTREYRCFLLLEWSDLVTEVREQFPLHELAETQAIAAALGVRHPAFSRKRAGRTTRREEPLTTDFLVRLVDRPGLPSQVALSVKTADALTGRAREVERLLEKAEIERRYWAARGVPFRLVTDREMPEALVHNLELVLPTRHLDGFPFPEAEVPGLLAFLYDQLRAAPTVPLDAVCKAADGQLQLAAGGALTLVWHAIATKQWTVDLTQRLTAGRPLGGLARGPGLGTGTAGWAA